MTLLLAAACQPAHLGDWRNLIAVIWDFLSLSLFSLGGGNTLLAITTTWPSTSTAG